MAAARKKKEDETPTAAEVKELAKEVEAAEEELDAVVVVKEKRPDGGINTKVLLNGSIEATEVQTLLELAVLGWRDQIGLGQPKR